MKEIQIKLIINDHQEAALMELQEEIKKYQSKEDGSYPFKDLTLEKTLEMVMNAGNYWTVWKRIKTAQYMLHMITPAEADDDKCLTVAERREKEAKNEL